MITFESQKWEGSEKKNGQSENQSHDSEELTQKEFPKFPSKDIWMYGYMIRMQSDNEDCVCWMQYTNLKK